MKNKHHFYALFITLLLGVLCYIKLFATPATNTVNYGIDALIALILLCFYEQILLLLLFVFLSGVKFYKRIVVKP